VLKKNKIVYGSEMALVMSSSFFLRRHPSIRMSKTNHFINGEEGKVDGETKKEEEAKVEWKERSKEKRKRRLFY
jgi:hypothetical protein